jgi:hypothetical protein
MKSTIHILLTDPLVREETSIEELLQREFSAGTPWFDE